MLAARRYGELCLQACWGSDTAGMPVQRWATNCLILHNPTKMMRVAYEIRQLPDQNGIRKFQVDLHVQRRVLVRIMSSSYWHWGMSSSRMHPLLGWPCMRSRLAGPPELLCGGAVKGRARGHI